MDNDDLPQIQMMAISNNQKLMNPKFDNSPDVDAPDMQDSTDCNCMHMNDATYINHLMMLFTNSLHHF